MLAEANPEKGREWAASKVVYLPNFYPTTGGRYVRKAKSPFIDIACFGAIRPLKNVAIQAVAAMRVADRLGKQLRFHVNASRIENQGEPVLKSLRTLFAHYGQYHRLVEHSWMPHQEFKCLCSTMDFGLQVSFTETFNLVSADLADSNVPIAVSPEIFWACPQCQVATTSSESIAKTMLSVLARATHVVNKNKVNLKRYGEHSRAAWVHELQSLFADD